MWLMWFSCYTHRREREGYVVILFSRFIRLSRFINIPPSAIRTAWMIAFYYILPTYLSNCRNLFSTLKTSLIYGHGSTRKTTLPNKYFQFCIFAQMNGQDFVVIAKRFVEGVISDLFPLYYIAGENSFKFEHFKTFFKPFTICRKNRVLAAHFLKGLCIFTSLL